MLVSSDPLCTPQIAIMVDLDNTVHETYIKITQANGEIPLKVHATNVDLEGHLSFIFASSARQHQS